VAPWQHHSEFVPKGRGSPSLGRPPVLFFGTQQYAARADFAPWAIRKEPSHRMGLFNFRESVRNLTVERDSSRTPRPHACIYLLRSFISLGFDEVAPDRIKTVSNISMKILKQGKAR
jgi:hypothetical protein